MHTEYHKWYSPALGEDMELKVYGHGGKAIVVFPCQDGRFYDYEGQGMVGTLAPYIESGRIQLYCVDGRDWESWTNKSVHPGQRAARHQDYDRHITEEVVPFIRQRTGQGRFFTTGSSMGAFHAANFFFRHPDAFDGVIALSGLYQLKMFIGDYMDENTYYNSPVHYLRNLSDGWYLDLYRQSQIVISVGQGAWEDDMRVDTAELARILDAKGVPAWVDFWGEDVNHDWPWWKVQLPYFLDKLGV